MTNLNKTTFIFATVRKEFQKRGALVRERLRQVPTYPGSLVLHEHAVRDVAVLAEVILDVLLGYRLILQPFKQTNWTRFLIFPISDVE